MRNIRESSLESMGLDSLALLLERSKEIRRRNRVESRALRVKSPKHSENNEKVAGYGLQNLSIYKRVKMVGLKEKYWILK